MTDETLFQSHWKYMYIILAVLLNSIILIDPHLD